MGALTMQLEKNKRDVVSEVEKITNTLNRQEREKLKINDIKLMLKGELLEYFLQTFEENQGNFHINAPQIIYNFFQEFENRNDAIDVIGNNEFERQYLNTIFDTTLKKAKKIADNDRNARFKKLPQEEQDRIIMQNMNAAFQESFINYERMTGKPFIPAPAGHNENKNKLKKHSIIAFLNMLFK